MYLILNDFLSKEEEQDFAITKKPTTEPAAEPAAEQKFFWFQSESVYRNNNNSSKEKLNAPDAIGRAKVVIAITEKKLKEICRSLRRKYSDSPVFKRKNSRWFGNVEETVQEKL